MVALRRVTDIHPAVCDCHPLGDGYIVELSCFHTYHTRFEREVDQMTTCRQCEADVIQESPDCMPAGSSPSGGPGTLLSVPFTGCPAPTCHVCSQPIVLLPGMVDPYLGPRRFGKPTCGSCALAIDLAENEAGVGA